MTFRGRLLAASMLTLALGLGALLVIGNVVLRSRADAEQAGLLRARAETEIAALDVRSGHVVDREPPNDAVVDREAWLFDRDRLLEGPIEPHPELERTAIALGLAGRTADLDAGDDTRLRSQPVLMKGRRVGAVVVGISTTSVERLEQYVLVGSVVIAALLLVAGWLAIRRAIDGALRPVARMTTDAAAWSANDLDQRFDLGPRRDELTGLAATLDALLARIAASRRHEQRLAAEVAHELRTPISRMRARAELALRAGPDAEEERTRALESVVTEVDRLTSAIEALLAAARREADPSGESVDLLAIAREAEDVTVHAPDDLPPAEGDPDVVRRALAPLLENAQRHARSRVELVLSASGGRVRITVLDDGPGVAPGLGERAFDPGVRGDDGPGGGAGLGLPLARRLARSCGGDVTIGEGPGGCFVLELPSIERVDRPPRTARPSPSATPAGSRPGAS
jgi:signal transduction histidine kinase